MAAPEQAGHLVGDQPSPNARTALTSALKLARTLALHGCTGMSQFTVADICFWVAGGSEQCVDVERDRQQTCTLCAMGQLQQCAHVHAYVRTAGCDS